MIFANKNIPLPWLEHDKQIRPYLWSHRILGISSKILSTLLFLSFIVTHRFVRLEQILQSWGLSSLALWTVYFGALALLWELVSLPFSISHHWIERAHHLSKQSYLSWFGDRLKGYGVGGVIGFLALAVVVFSLRVAGDRWWLVTYICFVLLSVILAQLAPVVLIPLFFKLKPLEEGELKARLLALSDRFGVKVEDVYHLGMGEKTEKGNAAFVGIGKTKKILIGDTLYKNFPLEEVEAVFAHELGHQVHGDLIKGIVFSSIVLFISFFFSQLLCEELIFDAFKIDRTHPFGVLMFFVVLSVIQWPLGIQLNGFSRWRERLADRFAKEKFNSGDLLASALERLTFQNRGLFCPNVIIEFLTYSHPAPWRRISSLRKSH
ncbi:MAG: M48 family peptidase [Proteobacteria bacterium]|nr:M48 family peptidase [Pseudomonadota bacterium]